MKHALILGCPRSGTSIFGELFEHLPYWYYFEPSVEALRHAKTTKPWAIKLPTDFTGLRTPGLAFDLDEILAMFPEKPMIFWVVRNPLDTICSLQPGLSDGWNHGPNPPDWEDLLKKPVVERAAYMWKFVNGLGYDAVQGHPHWVVHFEALIRDPLKTVQDVLQQLEYEFPGFAVHDYFDLLSDKTEGYEAKHQDRWVRHNHVRRIGRGKTELNDQDVETVRLILGELPLRFGYLI